MMILSGLNNIGGADRGLGVGLFFKAKATCGSTDVAMIGKWTGRTH